MCFPLDAFNTILADEIDEQKKDDGHDGIDEGFDEQDGDDEDDDNDEVLTQFRLQFFC